jgi:hypothetical protein
VSCCFLFTSSLYKTTSSNTCICLIILYLCLNVLFLEIYLSKHFCFDLNNLISRISDKSKFCNGPINFEIQRFNCTNMQFSEKYNIDYKQTFLLNVMIIIVIHIWLSFSAAPLIGLAVLAAIAGSTNTGATVVPGSTTILRQVPTPRVCPICPTMTAPVFPTLTRMHYSRLS